jgi:iron-sulfur cluster repair protein YtfE (RIC family)
MELDATQVRTIILDEHSMLRDELEDVRALLDEVAAHRSGAALRFHHRMKSFYDAFLKHIAHEDSLLRPVLREIDVWGPARVEKMDDEHRQQRATIAALTSLDPSIDLEGYLGRIRAFVTEVEKDMSAEERECLSPDILRDDTIVIDSFTG